MSDVKFVSYENERHKIPYMEMMSDYTKWLDDEVYKNYGVRLLQKESVQEVVERFTQKNIMEKPPQNEIYIIEVKDEPAGTGRLHVLEGKIAEVNNVWVNPEHRGKNYATHLMKHIEDKAKDYGFTSLRLDTPRFNVAAQNLYKKIGYYEIPRYTSLGAFENESLRRYYAEKVYMEKKL